MEKMISKMGTTVNNRSLESIVDSVKYDKYFESYCKDNNIDFTDEFIRKNLSKLLVFKQKYKVCENCTSLDKCEQMAKGYGISLVKDEYGVNLVNHPCKYLLTLQHNNKVADKIKSFFVPRKVLEASLENIDYSDDKRINANKAINNYVYSYQKGKTKKGLYLHGAFGVGKTYLLAALANGLAKKDVEVGFVYFPDLIRELKSAISKGTLESRIQDIKNIEVLILDDFGSELISPFVRDEVIGPILQYRYLQELPTMFSSNLNYKSLQSHYSMNDTSNMDKLKATRLVHRVVAMSDEIVVVGDNKRF